jgi:mxaJ protein
MRRWTVAALAFLLLASVTARAAEELRVCADPNNLPFSNDRLEGFENRIVDLLARDLRRKVRYTWWAQRRGFLRNTLKAGLCDLVPGVPSSLEMLATTRPYYRSTYVFVSRGDRGLGLTSFDDPRLRTLRVGVQMIGDDGANTPPRARARQARHHRHGGRLHRLWRLSRRQPAGADNRGGHRGRCGRGGGLGTARRLLRPATAGSLVLTGVAPSIDGPTLPMLFDISMGVRREDSDLKRKIGEALDRNRPEIDAILNSYGVPRSDPPLPVRSP